MIRKWRAFGVAFALTTIVGAAIAQQSTIGGQSARPRYTSVGVGQAAPAGTGNLTATGTVTAGTVNATSALQINGVPVTSGTYTPTLTNGTNVAASTSAQCQYIRVGNVVTVSGAIFVDPTAGAASTIIDISLPIASALSIHSNLAGGGSSSANGSPLNIQAQTVTDTARVLYLADAGGGNVEMTFTFTYVVL
jgi:hypothetical protein